MIAPEGFMPRRATKGSAGYDFFAPHDIHFVPGEWVEVDTGVCFDGSERISISCGGGVRVPVAHWFMMMVPRSGLGFKKGVRLANTTGIIDMDYRQTIRAKMTADMDFVLPKGEAFMQGIILPYGVLMDEVEPTKDRNGGFGSTSQGASQ